MDQIRSVWGWKTAWGPIPFALAPCRCGCRKAISREPWDSKEHSLRTTDVFESLTDEDEETQEAQRLIRQLLVDTRLVRQGPDLLTSGGASAWGAVLFPFGSFFCFLFTKRVVNCVIFPPLSPASLILIRMRQLEARGLFIFTLGTWTLKKGDWDSERRKGDFLAAGFFRQEFLFCFWFAWLLGVVHHLTIFSLGPAALSPSQMLISHHGQPLPAGREKAATWPPNTAHLQLYCYFVTVPQRKPSKIFKVFFEKGSSNVFVP